MALLGSKLPARVAGLCLAGGLLIGVGALPTLAARATVTVAPKATTILVSAGKPSDGALSLSRTELVPVGLVVFKVTNSGTAGQSFQICLSPSAGTAADVCDGLGQMTRLLAPGQSQTVTVKLAKKGTYEFMGTVAGQASPASKGLLGVGVKVNAAAAAAAASAAIVATANAPSNTPTTPVNDPGAAALLACMITSCDDDE